MKKKNIIIALSVGIFLGLVFNIGVPTKQGVDYEVLTYRIPLYIKIIEFVDRDYRYRRLVKKIINGKRTDEEKAIAILEWVRYNIKTDFPKDWKIYDDHILNIIIRGYGTEDQINDLFTTLCAYAGLPAGYKIVRVAGNEKGLILSFVRIKGEWCPFDAFRGVYFLNDKGDIASLDDIVKNRYDMKAAQKHIGDSRLTYEDYFKGIPAHIDDIALRPKMQMPLRRTFYELTNFFRDQKE